MLKTLISGGLMLGSLAGSAGLLWFLGSEDNAKQRLKMPDWSQTQHVAADFVVTEAPMPVELTSIGECVSKEEMQYVLLSMRPYFDLDSLAGKTPVGIMTHSLRLWGPDMTFATQIYGDGELAVPANCDFMLSSLLHHKQFLKNCSVGATALLTDSEYGVHALTNRDGVHNSRELLAHVAQLPAATAEIGLAASTEVTTTEGSTHTLQAIIEDASKRVVSTGELEWLMICLARYSEPEQKSWLNRFKQPVSFDDMVAQLCTRSTGTGACGGTHIPYALVIALRCNEKKKILNSHSERIAKDFLQKLSAGLEKMQAEDGSWDYDWPSAFTSDVNLLVPEEYEHPRMQKYVITGHQLEWMALASPDVRPSDETLRRAARYLVQGWPEIAEEQLPNWKNYNPVTHAARALWLVSGIPDHDHDFDALHQLMDQTRKEMRARQAEETEHVSE